MSDCGCCAVAREHPGHRFYSLGCPYCCARALHHLRDWVSGADELKARRRATLGVRRQTFKAGQRG